MKNFLKPDRHTHKDPEIRIASLDAMDTSKSETQIVIENMAINDSEESVRIAAIKHLQNVDALQRVQDAQPSMAKVLQDRIGQLCSDSAISDSDATALLAKQADVYAPLLSIYSASESVRKSALEKIQDEAVLLSVIEQSRFHDARLACAKNLNDDANVKRALSACKSRDKEVAKYLQARIDEKTSKEANEKQTTESVESTLAAMQTLEGAVWSPQYAGKYAALKAKWDTIEESYRVAKQAQFSESSEKVSKVISAKKMADQQQAAVEKTKADDASGSQSDAQSTLGSLSTQAQNSNQSVMQSATQSAKPDPARDALIAAIKTVKLEELDGFEYKEPIEAGSDSEKLLAHAKSVGVLFNPPYELNKARPGAIAERSKRTSALLETDKVLPGIALGEIQYIENLKDHLQQLSHRLDKAKQESLDRAKATHKQFAALSATITDGKWGPASSMFRRLHKKVEAMEPAERGQFADKLSRAEKQLDEMADWQDFAARPKLEALCESMEGLPAKEIEPDALAKEIKTYQAQWKSLGASRASNDLWTRFKTAGDTAYEPCKVYFAEKQEQREVKLTAKVQLCEQLEKEVQSIDWEAADYKALQRTVNNAKRDWSKNRVIDRKPNRALEQRFSDALKPIEEKLVVQYDANVLEKKDLIEKIKKLAEAEINQHSANQAKRLQSAWKQVGIVRRKDDQALWEEFNSHCKVIYKHQHEQKREKYQASMSHVFRARDIIKELRKISKGAESDESQVQVLQAEFQALDEFPDKDKKFLLRDFRGALDACSTVQENASKRRAKAEANEVVRLVELCEQLELAVESPDTATDTMRDDVKHAWEASEASVARETSSRLEARRDAALQHLDAKSRYDYDSNEKARRQLLIKLEILADIETPAEDKALRMQYQLENLREGMTSSAVSDKRAELVQLTNEWYAAPPAKQSAKDSLQSRFLAATTK